MVADHSAAHFGIDSFAAATNDFVVQRNPTRGAQHKPNQRPTETRQG